MNRMLTIMALCAMLTVAAWGCQDAEQDAAEEGNEVASDPAAVTAVVEAPMPSAQELPMPEDFGEEADRQINDGNYAAELDRIESAIAAGAED